ncbi:MAG: DUF1653 domain-containing protein [Aquabacterium sp.]
MDDSLPPLPTLQLGTYRHYKGKLYEVLGMVRHSETLAPLVLYRPMQGDGTIWVRPFEMFVESIEIQGVRQPRFAHIDASTGT